MGERVRRSILRIEGAITRRTAPLLSPSRKRLDLEDRRTAPPPRFGDLPLSDPIRSIVVRVRAGEPLTEADLSALRDAVGKLDRRNWVRSLVTAWALGRARVDSSLRDRVIETLASCLQMRQYAMNGCTTTLAVGCLFNSLISLPWLIYMMVRDGRVNAIRTEAAASLALLDCEWAVGDLAHAARVRNRPGSIALREVATMALQRLLPRIGPDHYGRLSPTAVTSLCLLLDQAHSDLHLPVLEALKHVGGSSTVTAVAAMTNEGWPAATREKAREVLEIVTARAEREREASRLLRPAQAPGSPEDILLRPVEAPPSGDVELLVRPIEGDEG